MSLQTMIRVWKHSQTRGAMRCLMLALADLANDDGVAWPGTAKLAEKVNETDDYTDVLIKKCIETGELIKVSGRGRGHKTRFAVLCGLDPDAQKTLKGSLQNPYSSTPFHERKGVLQKGFLPSEKRGTFRDMKQPPSEASGPGGTASAKNDILHDPTVGGVGDRARAKKTTPPANGTPPHVAYLASKGMGAAAEFARLDPAAARADFDNRIADGMPIGTIVEQWRICPPQPGAIYERQPIQSESSPGRARRSAVGTHNPERDAEYKRLIAEAERAAETGEPMRL